MSTAKCSGVLDCMDEPPRTAKVISFWTGERRAWPEKNGVTEEIKILKYWEHLLKNVDHGVPMDAIFVNNINELAKTTPQYRTYAEYLGKLDGNETKNGKIIVVDRPNIGAMIGSYNCAFHKYKDIYDYFWFSEDDRINISENSMKNGIDIIRNSEGKVGFVCTAKLIERLYKIYKNKRTGEKWRERLGACRGGAGIAATKDIEKCWPDKFEFYENESLEEQADVSNHEPFEYGLTTRMREMGYELSHLGESCDRTVHWGEPNLWPDCNTRSHWRKGWQAPNIPWAESAWDVEKNDWAEYLIAIGIQNSISIQDFR